MSDFDPIAKNCVTTIGNLQAPRTMLFLHGFGTDQTAWAEIAAAFADDFRLVLLDNVGAGRTPRGAFVQHRYLDLDAYVSDVLDVCAALDVRNAVLVGHSVGGMIAALASIRRPECASRLVLIGASARYLDDEGYRGGFTMTDLNGLYSAVMSGYAQWADRFAPRVMGNADRPHLALRFAESLKSIPPEHALTVLCSIFQSDRRADLGRIGCPTLLIHTREDVAVPPEAAQYLHEHIRGSRLEVIDAFGHLPHVSAPEKVVAAIKAFVDS